MLLFIPDKFLVVLQMIHLPVYRHIRRFVASVIKLVLPVLLFIPYQFFVVLQIIHLPVYRHIRRFVASVIKLILTVLLFIPDKFLVVLQMIHLPVYRHIQRFVAFVIKLILAMLLFIPDKFLVVLQMIHLPVYRHIRRFVASVIKLILAVLLFIPDQFCCITDDTSTCLSTYTKICSFCHQAYTGNALVCSLSIFVVLQMIHLPVYRHIRRFVASVIKLVLAVLLFIPYQFYCNTDDTSTCLSTHTKVCSFCHQACTGSALVYSLSIFVVLQMIHLPVYRHIRRFVASVIKLILAVLLFIPYQFLLYYR